MLYILTPLHAGKKHQLLSDALARGQQRRGSAERTGLFAPRTAPRSHVREPEIRASPLAGNCAGSRLPEDAPREEPLPGDARLHVKVEIGHFLEFVALRVAYLLPGIAGLRFRHSLTLPAAPAISSPLRRRT